VPLSGADAFLFAALALLAASVCMGKLQSVWVLIIGGCLGILNYEVNLQRLGNAISLWLGIQPPDLFFYAFLPPLLVDAALRLDWFTFSKLWPHIVLMAYGMVIINAAVLAPFILFVLGFSSRGWNWIQGAVLAAMLAPTDAVAVTAILKAGGGPENMVTIMEGEALLNDASAVTLYTVFLEILVHSASSGIPSVPSQIWPIIRDILKLTGIGVGIGLAFAWALGYVLKLLRWRGAKPYIESLVVLATAYLAFYVAQGPAKGSGVIAVCLFGLYGSATGHWGMLATDAESGIHEAVWDTVAFAANALVFFWSGISSVNFVARSASHLNKSAWNYGAIPIIYLFMYGFRGICLMAFNPIFKLMGARECALAQSQHERAGCTMADARGALSSHATCC
jgi:NhaP-type Na+/H+ or K+/H+ antiporter